MRTTSFLCICVALVAAACGEEGAAGPDIRLDGGIDGGNDSGIDGGGGSGSDAGQAGSLDAARGNCERRTLCLKGVPTDVTGLCTRECYGNETTRDDCRSAGLYFVCIVDPNGSLYYSNHWRGDVVVSSTNWTYSGWSNGLVPSTLSESDRMRCLAAKDARADAGIGECGLY